MIPAIGHLAELTQTTLLKLLKHLSDSLNKLDTHAPQFMSEFIPSAALPLIARHVNAVARSERQLGFRHLRDIDTPEHVDSLKRTYGLDHLHPALHPIVLTEDQTRGRTAADRDRFKQELEAQQRLELLYVPLTQRLLQLARMRGEELIGGEKGFKLLAEQLGPKIIGIIYDKLRSPRLFYSIVLSLSTKMTELCQGVIIQQTSPDYEDRSSPEHPPLPDDPQDREWEQVIREITEALPELLSTIMSIQSEEGKALRDMPVPLLRQATKNYFKEWPLIRLVNEFIWKPTVESMNPEGCASNGMLISGRKVNFHKLDATSAGIARQKEEANDAAGAKEALEHTKRMVLLGIKGNLSRIGNSIFDPIARTVDSIAVRVFCCCANPIKRILGEILRLIRAVIQIPLYPFARLFDFLLERYVSWQVPLTLQNMRHPINENLAIQLTFLFLDNAIERLKEVDREKVSLATIESHPPIMRTPTRPTNGNGQAAASRSRAQVRFVDEA